MSLTDVEVQLRTEVPLAYRDALSRVAFPMERLRSLAKPRPWRTVLEMLMSFGSLLTVPFVYAVYPHPLTFVASFILSLRTFSCFAQLVHTSDHGGLFQSPRLNMIAGNLCAYCLGYTRTGHRLTHLNHHVFLNRANDPDRIWGAPEQAARDLLRMWLKDFLLVSALARILQYSQSDRKTFSVVPWRRLNVSFFVSGLRSMWPVLVVQSVIVAYYSVVLGPTYYLFFYVFPIVTLYPAVIRLRTTVEHSFDVGFSPKAAEDYWVTRSTRGTVMERFLFSPLGIHHHFEHHLFPSIPHHNLTKVHQLLMESSFPIPIVPSYIGFVIGKIRAELALRQSVPR